jgi:hypothetical protein
MMILANIVVRIKKAPFWFLTLSFGHPATRSCYVQENTALLATLLTSECSYAEYADLTNEFELKDCAKEQLEFANRYLMKCSPME